MDTTIDRLQLYYGRAIRENSDSLQHTVKAIWAGLMPRCSTDENPQHMHCPAGPDLWCKSQQVQSGAQASYTHRPAIPPAVFAVLKPIYIQAPQQLLERCLRGATQSVNENFNGVVWGICPNEIFCRPVVVRIATGLAAHAFNCGAIRFERF